MTTEDELLERYTTYDADQRQWRIYNNDGKLIGQTRTRSLAIEAASEQYAEYIRSIDG